MFRDNWNKTIAVQALIRYVNRHSTTVSISELTIPFFKVPQNSQLDVSTYIHFARVGS